MRIAIVGAGPASASIPFQISAVRQGAKAVIRIIGHIGWETSAEDFRREVDALVADGVRDAHIYINSPGGSCFDANEIVNIIQSFKGDITGEGGALVASAGTYIAAHCKTFSMPANGQFMIHKPHGVVSGSAADLETYLKLIRNIEDEYFETYKTRATDPEDFEKKWQIGDNWMTATEAKAAGFITDVREKVKIDKETATMIAAYGSPLETKVNTNNNNPKINQMNIIALLLGLKGDATEAEIMEKIKELQTAASATDTLRTEMTALRDRQITALVDEGLAARKFTADKKEHFLSLGKTAGVDALRNTLDCMQPEGKPLDVVTPKTPGGATKKFAEMTADERITLRDAAPEEYKRLYKEEYGTDCKL